MKKLFLGFLIALLSTLIPCQILAQSIIEPVDSVWVDITQCDSISEDEMVIDTVCADELMNDLPIVTQYDLKEFEWVDICYNPKYAIVSKDGKKGIYDMMLHKNVTEIEYRDLGFSKQTVAEDSAYISMFYATKGIKRGIVSIYEPTHNVVTIRMVDPAELY